MWPIVSSGPPGVLILGRSSERAWGFLTSDPLQHRVFTSFFVEPVSFPHSIFLLREVEGFLYMPWRSPTKTSAARPLASLFPPFYLRFLFFPLFEEITPRPGEQTKSLRVFLPRLAPLRVELCSPRDLLSKTLRLCRLAFSGAKLIPVNSGSYPLRTVLFDRFFQVGPPSLSPW